MAHLRLTLLGGFQVHQASGEPLTVRGKKSQALLAYLALRPGRPQPRPKLAALLWGDRGDGQAQDSLRQTLVTLRRALPAAPAPSLLIEPATLALNPAAVEVDVAAFERAVADGTPKALEQAATLYQGDLLEGLDVPEAPFEEWLRAERERLRERAREALAQLLAQQSQAGANEPAIRTAARLLALDPLQESVHRTLMQLYVQQGRRPAALRQYQLCVSALQRELGVEPEVETRQLYQEILQQRARRSSGPEALAARARRAEGAVRRAPPAPRANETALIGRDRELTALRQAMAAAWRGQGRVVTLGGEAGIGKTRLVEELAAEWLEQGGEVLLGRAYDLEQILPFRPWVDALRGAQVLREDATLDGLGPVWRAELARLFPELGEPGARLPTGPQDQLRLFEAVARLVEQLGVRHPLLVVLEDLHWADEMSLRLLAFVARRLQARPLLLVGTVREEELPGAPLLGRLFDEFGREPGFVRLALPPLSQPDTACLVRALSRADREDAGLAQLAERIWRASEGNPFMIVETLRALQQGIPPETPGALPFPDRVRQVIAGRLDRLRPRARDLLAVAAVIGREFDFALLQHAAGLSASETAAGLEELVRRRVVHGVGDRFDVAHDRIREVAYAELLPPRRRILHGDVARALETLYAADLESHAAALGLHYREAQAWDRAVDYLRRAGTLAVARSAHREAVTSYEQALAALARLPESHETIEQAIDLRLDLRGPLWQLGELDHLLERLCEAEHLAQALGDQRRLGWLYYYLSGYFEVTAQSERAIDLAQRILEICTALEEPSLQLRGRFCLARVYYALGDYRRAADLARRNLEALEGDRVLELPGGIARPCVMSRWILALSLAELGEFTEAVVRGQEAVRITDTVDHSHCSVQHAYHGLGFVYVRKGDFENAISLLERALGLCRSSEAPIWFPGTASPLGFAYSLMGRRAEAIPMLEEAASKLEIPVFLPLLGAAYLHAGRADEAYRFARHALEVSRANKQRGSEAYTHWLFGEITSHRDPLDGQMPEGHFRQALALAEELGMRPLVAHCHLGLGKLYRRTGEREKAQQHLSTATTMYREMDMSFWLAQAEVLLKEVHWS